MSGSCDFQSIDQYYKTILMFKCSICGEETTSKESIRSHLRSTHSDLSKDLPLTEDERLDETSLSKKDEIITYSKSERLLEKLDTAIRKLDGSLRQGYENAKRKSFSSIDVELPNIDIMEYECANGENYMLVKEEELQENDLKKDKEFLSTSPRLNEIKEQNNLQINEIIVSKSSGKPIKIISDTKKKFPRFECGSCMAAFFTKTSLDKHKASIHKTFAPLKCDLCSKQFRSLAGLKKHKKFFHDGMNKEHQCEICKKWFHHRYAVNFHIRTHHQGVKKAQCHLCGLKLTTNAGLKNHIAALHEKKEEFECTECGKRFNIMGSLKRHLKTIHDPLSRYPCDLCNKTFSSSGKLLDHKRIHTNDKPYICLVCKNEYKTAMILKTHLNSHLKRGDINTINEFYLNALKMVKERKGQTDRENIYIEKYITI
ncbi:DgyrCDS8861 [Dimorphilus gyrociliatus]|uniref:DgyrCDS8861 n=1 Tax=Dimorphilus gyrociliatus TaxID=2664684 RepID=A0A7I8W0J7_9ANNE|nr:DgyrCDS8861 [Dimorphilus gyrociliatus]